MALADSQIARVLVSDHAWTGLALETGVSLFLTMAFLAMDNGTWRFLSRSDWAWMAQLAKEVGAGTRKGRAGFSPGTGQEREK